MLKILPKNILVLFFLIFIFVIGLRRSFAVVAHEPVYAYANSYDMIRLQACHNILPLDKGAQDGQGTPNAPLQNYIQTNKTVGTCYPSSESLFVWAGLLVLKIQSLFHSRSFFDIRVFGIVRMIIFFLFAAGVSCMLYKNKHYQSSFINAVFFTMVLSDPGVTLYANTFYTEYSAVFGLYVSMSMLYLFLLKKNNWYLTFACFGLLTLGLSKPQHMLLPLVLVGIWLILQKVVKVKVDFPATLLLMFSCVLALSVQLYSRTLRQNKPILSQ
jgi:hypothetical protein